jgi:putative molybdopterin biosynthesis protein
VEQLKDPGIVAHGVALKPGKPICLAASQTKPIVILPGFPTSAVFTFHEFVAPVIRQMAGQPKEQPDLVTARMATKVNSEIGRTEYLLVGLVQSGPQQDDAANLAAYPMGKGSGSVTTFSRADGFVTLDRNEELVEQGRTVQVRLLGRDLELADLVVIGSHCVGLDLLLSQLRQVGVRGKLLSVGSTAGLAAAARGECDVAGVHLLDPATGRYNTPFLQAGLTLIPGYRRRQGILFRPGDRRFEGRTIEQAVAEAKRDGDCRMVNRNQGSGTRILIDQLLADARPDGYAVQARSHNAVAASIAQQRADWGVAIELVARQSGLGFIMLADEVFDFVIPDDRLDRPSVQQFVELLDKPETRAGLAELGLIPRPDDTH